MKTCSFIPVDKDIESYKRLKAQMEQFRFHTRHHAWFIDAVYTYLNEEDIKKWQTVKL